MEGPGPVVGRNPGDRIGGRSVIAIEDYYQKWDRQKKKVSDIQLQLQELVGQTLAEPGGAYAGARRRELGADIRTQHVAAQGAERRLSENLASRGMTQSGLYKEGVEPIQRERFARIAELQRGSATDIAERESMDRERAIRLGMEFESRPSRQERWAEGYNRAMAARPKPWGIIGHLQPRPNVAAKQKSIQELQAAIERLRGMVGQGGETEQPGALEGEVIVPRYGPEGALDPDDWQY